MFRRSKTEIFSVREVICMTDNLLRIMFYDEQKREWVEDIIDTKQDEEEKHTPEKNDGKDQFDAHRATYA